MLLLLAACASPPVPPGTTPPAVALAPSPETRAALSGCDVVAFLATGSPERAVLSPYFEQLGAVVTDQALDRERAQAMGIRADRQVGVRCGDHRVRLALRGIDPEMDTSVRSALETAARPVTPAWWTGAGARSPALTADLSTSLGHLAVTLGETVPVRPVEALPKDAALLVLAERSPPPAEVIPWVEAGGSLLVLLGDDPAPLVPLLDQLGVTVGPSIPSEGALVLAHPVTATIGDRPLVLGSAPALSSSNFTPLFSAPVAAALTVGKGRVIVAPAALFSDQALASHGNLQLLFGVRTWLLPPDPPLYVGKSRVEPFVDPEPVELTTPALRLTWAAADTVTVEEREDAAGVYPWVTVTGAKAFRGNTTADDLLKKPVKSIREIPGDLDLHALGLEPPAATLTVATVPGDSVSLSVGGKPWKKDEQFVLRDNVTWLVDGRAFAPLEFPDRLRETRLQPLYLPELVALELDGERHVPTEGHWDDTAAAVALAVREAKARDTVEAPRTRPRMIRFVGTSATWELAVWPEKKGCVVRSSWLRATVKVEPKACEGMLGASGSAAPPR